MTVLRTAATHRVGRPRPGVCRRSSHDALIQALVVREARHAELEVLRRSAARQRAALRTAWALFGAAVLAFYLVPTGAALDWW